MKGRTKMNEKQKENLTKYRIYLTKREKSRGTVLKYCRDASVFLEWLAGREMCREVVIEYKAHLAECRMPSGVNSVLSSLNGFFDSIGRPDLRVKKIRIQKRAFGASNRELTKDEYRRLLAAAEKKSERLYFLMQTICSTGIRVSELRYVSVECLDDGIVLINCKGKQRQILLPKKLCTMLKGYARRRKIKSGPLFVTRNGRALDRSNIWTEMKKLCTEANVPAEKVFPHNLRHLFARTYYSMHKDIVRLADILGHSNIDTTRIYTIESGETHRKQLQKLGLLLC